MNFQAVENLRLNKSSSFNDYKDQPSGDDAFEPTKKRQELNDSSASFMGENQKYELTLNERQYYNSAVNDLCKDSGIEDVNKIEQGLADKVQSCFRDFFDGLCNFGMASHGDFAPDVAAKMPTIVGGAAPVASTGIAIVRTICAQLAYVFRSSSEEVARTIFSGVCIASTAIRTALPIALEMATTAKNQEEIFIFSVAAAVMASVYLVTSSISVLLAGHNAILNSPTTAAMAKEVMNEAEHLPDEKNEDFSKAAQESLKKIGRMLTEWKVNASANLLSLGKEILLFGGAVISAVSALSKFAPVLTVPFVSIITGSISLIANVVEVVQGIVEYRNQKAKLEELNSGTGHGPENRMEMERLENQLKLSKARIAKGALNVLIAIGNIALGVFAAVTAVSVPIVPAILAAVSMTTVLILGIASLVVRKANNASTAASEQVSFN